MHTFPGASPRLIGSDFSGPCYSQSTAIPHTTYSWNTTLAPVLNLPFLRSTPSCSLDVTKRPSSLRYNLASKPFLPRSTTEMQNTLPCHHITHHIKSHHINFKPAPNPCRNDPRQPRLCRLCLYIHTREEVWAKSDTESLTQVLLPPKNPISQGKK